MARIYTGGGDHGETRLWDGSRVSKLDPRIELNGVLDETSSAVGLARSLAPASVQPELLKVQKLLQDLMAYVARGRRDATPPSWKALEAWIDEIGENYPMRPEFVFPGDSPAGGALHVARSTVRRAERAALPLWDGGDMISEDAYKFINRLSDLLYALAHKADVETQVERIVRKVMPSQGGATSNQDDSGVQEKENKAFKPAVQDVILDEALEMIEAAKLEAEAIKVPMVISICSPDGALLAFQRMKNSLPVSVQVSMNKATTALKLKMDTRDLAPLIQPGAPLYGLTNDSSIVAFGGGRLLKVDGVIVGAVGVSGGSPDEDMQVSDAAVRCFESLRKI